MMKKKLYPIIAATVLAVGCMTMAVGAENKTPVTSVEEKADEVSLSTASQSPSTVKNGWIPGTEAGEWYYAKNGAFVKNAWVGDYYLGSDGKMLTSTITPDGYYVDGNGKWQTGWKSVGSDWYYFNSKAVKNKWVGNYYLGSDGKMLKNTETPDGYYVDASGKWKTGWVEKNGKWYYYSSKKVTGWKSIGGTWYYMDSKGVMKDSAWVGNYYVAASGAMVKNCYVYNPANGNYYWVDSSGNYVSKWTTKTKPASKYSVYNQYTGKKIQ